MKKYHLTKKALTRQGSGVFFLGCSHLYTQDLLF